MTIDLHRRSSRFVTVGAVAAAAAIALSGCSAAATPSTAGGDGTGTITVWAHQGEDSENSALQAAVAA